MRGAAWFSAGAAAELGDPDEQPRESWPYRCRACGAFLPSRPSEQGFDPERAAHYLLRRCRRYGCGYPNVEWLD